MDADGRVVVSAGQELGSQNSDLVAVSLPLLQTNFFIFLWSQYLCLPCGLSEAGVVLRYVQVAVGLNGALGAALCFLLYPWHF